ncbi:hypothetical protein PAECIP111802_07110 [Paenibacillus allorhizosphaerae]|uniref:Uncharacterized protein n=1 Tax=Paenibacillus allorhizosphaerae TaxID=2849866 RepID=A0ABN7TZV0_9BACL|nr:hypothetical protein PAECIP111802_07110 [Paenibacillus allorhizosphaerae]
MLLLKKVKWLCNISACLSLLLLFQLIVPLALPGLGKQNYVHANGSADTIPPSAPQNLYASQVTGSSVTLNWNIAADNQGVVTYAVYRNNLQIATVGNNVYQTGKVYYVDSGLTSGTAYKYEVLAADQSGNTSAKSDPLYVTTSAVMPLGPTSQQGSGLRAEYFNSDDFSDRKIIRLDDQVDFNWGGHSPDPALDKGAFTIRWSGKIQPKYSEKYTLYTEAHGGVRMWVGQQLLIDNWDGQGMIKDSAVISLTAGQLYDIKLEYKDNQGAAKITLLWSSTSQPKEVIPKSQLYPPIVPGVPTNVQYSSNSSSITITWDAVPGVTGYDVEVDGQIVDNASGLIYVHQPLAAKSTHSYRVRAKVPEITGDWSPIVNATTRGIVPANFQANAVDRVVTVTWDSVPGALGYELEVDGSIIDLGTATKYEHVDLKPNTTHSYRVRAKNNDWSIFLTVIIPPMVSTPGQGSGLRAEYFNSDDFSDRKIIRLDDQVNFNWGGHSPDPALDKSAFTIRWSGKIQPKYSEKYTLYTEAHGGVRLWVGQQLLIDNWDGHGMVKDSTVISFTAGQLYDIKLEYKDNQGAAKITLLWSSPSQLKEVIPKSQLYPPFIPGVPTNVQYSSNSKSITITWDAVPGAAGYDVEVDGQIVDITSGLTYVHQPLAANSTHTYRVRAKVPEITGDWSPVLNAITRGGVPANFQANAIDRTVTVTWDTVPGALGYELEVDGSIIDLGTATKYEHADLMADTTHSYRVRARNEQGVGDWTSLISLTVQSEVPTNLKAASTARSITLSWDRVPGALNYEIEADNTVIANVTETVFTHYQLEPNTGHSYRVRATLPGGPRPWSPVIYKSTLPEAGHGTGLKGEYFEQTTLTDLKHTRVDSQVEFDWNHNSPAPGVRGDEFSVRWTGQIEPLYSETYTLITEAHGGARLWVNENLIIDDWEAHNSSVKQVAIPFEAGKRYDIRLEYRETNGTSRVQLSWKSASQPLGVVPKSLLYPIGVPQQVGTSSTETTVTVQWNPVSYAAGYDVEIDGTTVVSVIDPNFVHQEVMPGTLHNYRIRATNGMVIGEWSSSVSEITKLGRTTILEITPTETTLDVSWDTVYGATGYDIEVDGVIVNNDSRTTYLHEPLLSGTEHSYRVRAKTAYRIGDWSEWGRKWTLPGLPEGIIATAISTSVTVEWLPVRGATGYDIETAGTIIDNGNVTSYQETDLNPNTQHVYKIRAKNSSGVGKWSSVIAKSTLTGTPANLHGEATETSIQLYWDAVAGATGYELQIDGTTIQAVDSAKYIHNGLQPNETHRYSVRSKNAEGTSPWSPSIELTTLPAIPTGFHATADTLSIQVAWDQVQGATGYDIEVDGAVISTGTMNAYVHAGLVSNSEHTYRVRAITAKATGRWSEKITKITRLSAPTNVHASTTGRTITLTWDPIAGVSGYEVEADGSLVQTGPTPMFEHRDLAPYTTHQYRVRTQSAGGAGDWSSVVTAKTMLGTTELAVDSVTVSSISVRWNVVAGAEGYDLFIDGEVVDAGTGTSYTHTGLSPYSWHVYRVRARASESVGEWSEALSKSTQLGIPGNIRASTTSSEITVSWDTVSGAAGYDIEADGTIIDNSPDTVFVHRDLAPNSQHTYRIRAKNENGAGEWSDLSSWSVSVIIITAPDKPRNVKATATTGSITLTWDPSAYASGYDIEIDGQVLEGTAGTNYTHGGLEPNTMHVYRVRANNGQAASEWTDKVQKITTPELTVTVEKDTMFNFIVVAPKKNGVTERKVTVLYRPDELEVLDLSAITPELELSAGDIAGTNITVEESVPGKIVFRIRNADKTVVNSIKFQCITSGEYPKVTYTIE